MYMGRGGLGAIEGAVFGLLALLVAFTFSGAAARFDTRRQLIVEETNAIGTAYLRLDLLPADAQPTLRERFRQYLEARLETYRKIPDVAAVTAALARSAQLQTEIWRQAVAGSRMQDAHPDAARLLLLALNAMIDMTTTRNMATQTHPPLRIGNRNDIFVPPPRPHAPAGGHALPRPREGRLGNARCWRSSSLYRTPSNGIERHHRLFGTFSR